MEGECAQYRTAGGESPPLSIPPCPAGMFRVSVGEYPLATERPVARLCPLFDGVARLQVQHYRRSPSSSNQVSSVSANQPATAFVPLPVKAISLV